MSELCNNVKTIEGVCIMVVYTRGLNQEARQSVQHTGNDTSLIDCPTAESRGISS